MQDKTPLDKKIIEDIIEALPDGMTSSQMVDLIYNMLTAYGMEHDWHHMSTLVSAAVLGLLDPEDYEDEEEEKVIHA